MVETAVDSDAVDAAGSDVRADGVGWMASTKPTVAGPLPVDAIRGGGGGEAVGGGRLGAGCWAFFGGIAFFLFLR